MKNYTKKELQSMSDWNLVQIYCDEMGGIDENDLMIEVRGNKEERENLISQLLQRMKSKYKDGGGVSKDKVFEVAYYGKKHLKQRGSSKGNYKTWVVATNREEAIEKVKNDDDEFADLKSAKPTNLDVERYKMKTGGMVVTSIKDIPNFKKRLDEGKITYRGLGMGKLSNDFYDLSGGEHGTRIKVDGKEYFITDTEFDTFSRGADGKMRIRFAAPYRKGYSKGGGIDINDLNMPVIRTQFEDEEYEFKDGGNVGVDLFEDNNKQPIKVRKILSKYELEDGMDYRVLSKMQKELESIGYTFDYYLDGVPYDLRKIGQKGKLELEQENDDYANGGSTKGFCYTIGGL